MLSGFCLENGKTEVSATLENWKLEKFEIRKKPDPEMKKGKDRCEEERVEIVLERT